MRNKTKISMGNRLVTVLVIGVVALALYDCKSAEG